MNPPAPDNHSNRFWLWLSIAGWLGCFLLASDRLRGLLTNSALLASGTLFISLPLGLLLAVAIAKTDVWGRLWLERLMIVLLCVPLYVQATAWQAALGQGGYLVEQSWLASWTGAIWIHAMAAVPWVVLLTTAALRNVPRELEEEALQDSASWQVIFQISLPNAFSGIGASALWITFLCFSEIAVTDLFQVRTFAEEIYTAASLGVLDSVQVEQVNSTLDTLTLPQFQSRDLWIGIVVVALLALFCLQQLTKCFSLGGFVSASSDWVWPVKKGWLCAWVLVWGIAILVVGIPMLGLAGKSGILVQPIDGQLVRCWSPGKAAQLVLTSPWQNRREFGWTLAIAAVVTFVTVSVAIVIAWTMRTKKIFAWPATLAISVLLAIPGPLLAVWLIRLLNQPTDSWLSALTWCYDHTILAPVLVQIARALPMVTLVMHSQFARLPQDILDSSRSEGAGWLDQLRTIALPACLPAIMVSMAIAIIVSLGELAATLLVVPPGVSPLSVRIFGLIHYGAEDKVSALCLFLVLSLAILSAAFRQVWQIVNPTRNLGQ